MTNKTYYNLNFKRTKNHLLDDEELNKTHSDFEIRRMLIDDYINHLHVLFSKRMVAKWLSILFMTLGFISMFMNYGKDTTLLFGCLSFLFIIVRFFYMNKYKKIMKIFMMSIGFIDLDIKKKYKMDMPPIF